MSPATEILPFPPSVRARESFLPNNFINRAEETISVIFRYTMLTGITVGSAYFLGQRFLGRSFILLLSSGIIYGAAVYASKSVKALSNGHVVQDKVADKINLLIRTIFWSLMILGALAAGWAGGYFLTGVSFLYVGIQTGNALSIVLGLIDLTFTLGFSIPLARSLLPTSLSLYRSYNDFIKTLSKEEDWSSALGKKLIDHLFDSVDRDILILMLRDIPNERLCNLFISSLPILSNTRITEFIANFPDLLTVDFLATHLSTDQFNEIVIPQFTCPISKEDLEQILSEIEVKEKELTTLEKEGNPSEILEKAEKISIVLNKHRNKLLQFRDFARRLPEQNLDRYETLQKKIDEARELKEASNKILQTLLTQEEGSLQKRLELIRSRNYVEEISKDGDDPNYEVLGAYGFTTANFRQLGTRLELNLGNQEIERTCKHLDEFGLQNRDALIKNHILDKRPDGQPLDSETLINRIVNFCKGSLPDEAVVPVEVANQPRWARVSLILNNVFHVTLTGSLIGIQLYYNPISTLAGFFFELIHPFSQNPLLGRLSRIFSPSPDYIHQSLPQNMRYIYVHIWATTWGLRIGAIGGFITGSLHAQATRFYIRQWQGRIQRTSARSTSMAL